MDVGSAAVVPDKCRPFQTPVVPDAVVADIVVLVERDSAGIQTAMSSEALASLFAVNRAVRLKQQIENFADVSLLIVRQFADRDSLMVVGIAKLNA